MEFLELIQEGRKDDFIQRYSKKFNPEQIKKITTEIQPKYLDWVGKVIDPINFESNFAKLVVALEAFERLSSNLPLTDINQYKSVVELINALATYENRQRRSVRKVEGGNVVYEDDRFFIVNPLTHSSSCYYGKGTKWCTAADSDYNFKKYNEDGKLFYILDKTLSTSDPLYKVAILKKFDGDTTYWNAVDDNIKSGWIFNTNKLKEILSAIDGYINTEYAEQVKIFSDKVAAQKERERLRKLEIQRIQRERENDAQERRDENEWELGPNCPDEGLKAHALLDWLVDNNDVEVKTNEDIIEIQRLNDEIERLNQEYNNDEEVRQDLLDEISILEDELEELQNKIDVYNIFPTGTHYDMTEFEVLSDNVSGRRYAVGDESETESSARDYVEQLIDDVGYAGINANFAKNYIDNDAVVDYAQELYDDDVRSNPEVYFDDSERLLSDEQEEKIEILKMKIGKTEETISHLESQMDGDEGDNDIQEKIDEFNDVIQEMNDEIEEIEGDPEGDFPEDLFEDKVSDLVEDVRRNPEWFMSDFGLEWENYIDKDGFIQGVIDEDGYGHTLNSYDGTIDEIYVENKLFYVMRID